MSFACCGRFDSCMLMLLAGFVCCGTTTSRLLLGRAHTGDSEPTTVCTADLTDLLLSAPLLCVGQHGGGSLHAGGAQTSFPIVNTAAVLDNNLLVCSRLLEAALRAQAEIGSNISVADINRACYHHG